MNPCIRVEDPLRMVTCSHVLAKGFILVFAHLLLETILMKAALRNAKKPDLLLRLSGISSKWFDGDRYID